LSAVALPLATYTTALALFGLAHVGSELRSKTPVTTARRSQALR
jgi:hypothetical protein